MTTLLGTTILPNTRGILYLCEYNYENRTIAVSQERLYSNPAEALHAYANIPNPASQMASGPTFHDFMIEIQKLHHNMSNPKWVKELADYL